MRKELKELVGCLCEQTEDTEVLLEWGDYTLLAAEKNKYGLNLVAYGEGEVRYKPMYCPFCGKKLLQRGM